jgi:hypothetical protein
MNKKIKKKKENKAYGLYSNKKLLFTVDAVHIQNVSGYQKRKPFKEIRKF